MLPKITFLYQKKGSKVYIEGRLRPRKWQDQQGVERYTTEIIASELQMLDGVSNNGVPQPQAGQGQRSQQGGYSARPANAPAQGQMPTQGGYNNNTQRQRMPAPGTGSVPMAPIDFDDVPPF